MQAIRLVKGGEPDRIIVFDSLPKEFLASSQRRSPAGLPRHWSRWLEEIGSIDPVTQKPCFWILDYLMVNNDRETWQNISQYVRRTVDTKFRLMDKLEEMGKPMAKDSRVELSLEPEDITTIPVPQGEPVAAVAEAEPEVAPVRRRRVKEAA